MTTTLKLRTRKGEMVDEDGEHAEEDLMLWVEDQIPPAPTGQLCEKLEGHQVLWPGIDLLPLADSSLWYIKGEHVCYIYVCWECSEIYCGDGLEVDYYPTTLRGNAVTPTHCS